MLSTIKFFKKLKKSSSISAIDPPQRRPHRPYNHPWCAKMIRALPALWKNIVAISTPARLAPHLRWADSAEWEPGRTVNAYYPSKIILSTRGIPLRRKWGSMGRLVCMCFGIKRNKWRKICVSTRVNTSISLTNWIRWGKSERKLRSTCINWSKLPERKEE